MFLLLGFDGLKRGRLISGMGRFYIISGKGAMFAVDLGSQVVVPGASGCNSWAIMDMDWIIDWEGFGTIVQNGGPEALCV